MSTLRFDRLTAPLKAIADKLGLYNTTKAHIRQARKNHPRRMAIEMALLPIALAVIPTKIVAQTEPPTSTGICQSQLEQSVSQILNRPELRRSRWGILVETLAPSFDRTLYSLESDRFFTPASNAKLLTTAAALTHLGPEFRIRTSVYGSDASGPTLDAIRIVGRGDPSLSATQLSAIAQQLQQQGIREIREAIGQDTYFHGSAINPNWEWEDVQAGYGAPINSLIYNRNAIELELSPQRVGQPLGVSWADPRQAVQWRIENNTLTVEPNQPEFLEVERDFTQPTIRISGQLRAGSASEDVYVAVVEPGMNFLDSLRDALTTAGITVGRATVSVEEWENSGERELAAIESPPLSELVKEVLLDSDNLYTEALLRSLGANPNGKGKSPLPEDTIAIGLEVLEATLAELGVNPESYELVDGSGLSRQNLMSPEALVQTLRAMANSPYAEVYRAALPVAGVSGTLRFRFRDTPAAGMVRAKTGTLTGVSALSGYVPNQEYDTLVFSIMVNQSDRSSTLLRQAIDEIVVLLTQLRRC